MKLPEQTTHRLKVLFFFGLPDPLLNFGSGIRFKTDPRASGSFGNDPPGADRGDVVSRLAALGGHAVAL
jgi:hypothetical protein